MTSDAELRHRETERRKALWTLVHILPGDVRALDALDVLDDIEQRERVDTPKLIQRVLQLSSLPSSLSISAQKYQEPLVTFICFQFWRDCPDCCQTRTKITRWPLGLITNYHVKKI